MEPEDRVEPESVDDADMDRPPVPPEWQFSLRSLLITTTIASICLAMGTFFAGFMFVIVVVVVIQLVMLLSVDWLIRPANRRLLAFVIACIWVTAGAGLLLIATRAAYQLMLYGLVDDALVTVVLLAAAAAFCFWAGWRRWRLLTAHRRANL